MLGQRFNEVLPLGIVLRRTRGAAGLAAQACRHEVEFDDRAHVGRSDGRQVRVEVLPVVGTGALPQANVVVEKAVTTHPLGAELTVADLVVRLPVAAQNELGPARAEGRRPEVRVSRRLLGRIYRNSTCARHLGTG